MFTMYLFNKYVFSSYYVPGIRLGLGDLIINKKDHAQPEGGSTVGPGGPAKGTGAGRQEGSLTSREASAQERSRRTRTQANHRESIKV